MGPSGTRTTTIVRRLCNIFPEGILYHEITETENFVELLAEEVGMQTKPTRISDLMLSHITVRPLSSVARVSSSRHITGYGYIKNCCGKLQRKAR